MEHVTPARPTGPTPRARDFDDARDMALVHAHRAGDPKAMTDLLTRYQDRLFAVCLRMCGNTDLARDLTQDTMVKVIKGLDQFDGRSRLSTWLIRIAINVCLTERRRSRLRRTASLDTPRPETEESRTLGDLIAGTTEPGPEERVEQSEARRVLFGAMERIDPAQRAILILRDVQALDYARIAEILEIPVGTVKSRLFRSRSALRDQIEHLRGF